MRRVPRELLFALIGLGLIHGCAAPVGGSAHPPANVPVRADDSSVSNAGDDEPEVASGRVGPDDFAVVADAWQHALVGGRASSVDGLVASDTEIWVLVTSRWDGGASLVHRPIGTAVSSSGWSREVVVAGDDRMPAGTVAGSLLWVGSTWWAAIASMDATTMTVDSTIRTPRGAPGSIARGCPSRPISLLHDPPRDPLVVYTCGDRLRVARAAFVDGAVTVRQLAALDPRPAVVGVDGHGRIHVLATQSRVGVRYFVVSPEGETIERTLDPSIVDVNDVGTCGGVVHATFAVTVAGRTDGTRDTALGRLVNDRWTLEALQAERTGGTVLGFDRACHPFVAGGDRVWSRARDGWRVSSIGEPGASVRALVVRDGMIYAGYTVGRDSERAGVASAQVRIE